jgi:hypothetical protein
MGQHRRDIQRIYINDPKKTRNRHSAKTLTTPCKLKAQGSPCPDCGTAVVEILKLFGGKPAYIEAIREMEKQLYAPAA